MTTSQTAPQAPATDTFPINGTDFVEFWVGNASSPPPTISALGLPADRLPRPRDRHPRPVQLCPRAEQVRFVLTTAWTRRSGRRPCAQHGDGVRDIAFWVDDARQAFAKAIERGASRCRSRPAVGRSGQGRDRRDPDLWRHHPFDRRARYRGLFLPGFSADDRRLPSREPVGLKYVDHCVGNVELGKMNDWVDFYERRARVLNLHHASTTRTSRPSIPRSCPR